MLLDAVHGSALAQIGDVGAGEKLQGKYLGALKSLTGANRAKVKAVAKEKGVATAVKMALSLKKPQ